MKSRFRLIVDSPRPASLNMALDEYFLDSLAKQDPVLRIYAWERPCYTIGYFQNLKEEKEKYQCEKKGIPMVRRITGGGLVFHGADVTFALTIQQNHALIPQEVKSSYLKINEALIAGLKPLYEKIDFADCRAIPSGRPGYQRVCFDAPSCYDLMLNGKKVGGASQRRRAGVLLHQSSLFLNQNFKTIADSIQKGLSEKWDVEFYESILSAEEIQKARTIEEKRYSDAEWAISVS